MKTRCKSKGLTLIEVLLVIAILGVLAAMVVPRLVGRQKQANIDATRLSIKGLEEALKLYSIDHDGEFPTTHQGLDALYRQPDDPQSRWKGPYLDTPAVDAWGRPLNYTWPGQRRTNGVDIYSAGPDGQENTEDDITNWDEEV